jgi:hypothetical protein
MVDRKHDFEDKSGASEMKSSGLLISDETPLGTASDRLWVTSDRARWGIGEGESKDRVGW